MTIIANPNRVCEAHAREFWTGLLVYTRDRSGKCVKEHEVCSCALCKDLGPSFAVPGVGDSAAPDADFGVRLAS